MKNTLNYSSGAQTLLANVNDDTNRIFINGTEIPSTDWTGTGTFTYSVEGATISIARIADTSGNIMLQKVDTDSYRLIRKEESSYLTTTGDTKDNVATFTSADNDSVFNSGNLAGQSAYAWNAVATMASEEKHSSLFNKISTMFKNIRTIAKLLGTTDISSIGGGTISGAINALNVSLANKLNSSAVSQAACFSKNALVYGNTTTSYTNAALKTASAILVTANWNGYRESQIIVRGDGSGYHFPFDYNGSLYTAVIKWTKSSGNVQCTNRNDVYIDAISLINPIT